MYGETSKQVTSKLPNLPWLCNRQYYLLTGTLLLPISPFLSCTFFVGSALFSIHRKIFITKEAMSVLGVILVISGWMYLRKVRPEIYDPGFVSFSDYVPFFIFFSLISLKPFSEVESESFSYALILTIPQEFLMAYGERYWGWYGQFHFQLGNLKIFDIFIGPFVRSATTSGSFFNPNILAIYCIISVGIAIGLFLKEIEKLRNSKHLDFGLALRIALVVFCLFFVFLLLVWTGSRNAWIAFVFMSAFYAVFSRKRWIYLLGAALVLLTIFASIEFGVLSKIAKSLIPTNIAARLPSIYYSLASNDRGPVFQCVVDLIKEKPLGGWGIGSFALECWPMHHAHNIFLQLGSEIGLPFTVLIVTIMGYILFLSFRHFFKSVNRASCIYSLDFCYLTVVLSVILMQIFDLSLLMTYRLNFLFWICLAIPYSRAITNKL